MKIHWNNCFLCLNDLTPPVPSTSKATRRKRNVDDTPSNENVTILMKYLLQTDNKKYDKLLQGILEASRFSPNCIEEKSPKSTTFPLDFCDKCISSIKRVSELHMQLETLQMKLVDSLKSVKETIIVNSKAYGCNEATKACLQMFEAFLVTLEENQQGLNESSQLDRKRLDLLYSFQDAIYETARDTPRHIPFVFLEAISPFKPQLTSMDSQQITVEVDPSFIKIEHAASQLPEEEFGETYSPDIDLMDFSPSLDSLDYIKEEKKTSTRAHYCTTSDKVMVKVRRRNKSKSIDTTPRVTRSHNKSSTSTVGLKKIQPTTYSLAKRKRKALLYKCETCSFITKRDSSGACIFEHHLRGHETAGKIHTCSICEQKFSGKQLFEYHMNLHAGGTSVVACDFDGCSSGRVPRAELPDHIKTSHGVKVLLCQCCSFSSATREKYMMHIKLHGKHCLNCDVCSAKFQKREKLFSHLFEEHGLGKKLKCEEDGCEETFLDPLLLFAHKRAHNGKAIFVCKECNQSFTCKESRNVHMQRHSKRERSYNCDLCTELFISRFALENHKLKDHDAPKLICTYCQQEFPDYRKLLRHITKNHEGARYPCSYCHLTFRSTTRWHSHQYAHSGSSTFVCEECGKVFQTRPAWKSHLKIHREKMYKCSYCPKSFNMYRYLKEHVYIHTGEKPWVCDHCGKAFTQQGSMQIHKRKVHELHKDPNKGEVSPSSGKAAMLCNPNDC